MFSYLMPAEKGQSSKAADSSSTPGLQPSLSNSPLSPGRHAGCPGRHAGCPAVIEQSRFAIAQAEHLCSSLVQPASRQASCAALPIGMSRQRPVNRPRPLVLCSSVWLSVQLGRSASLLEPHWRTVAKRTLLELQMQKDCGKQQRKTHLWKQRHCHLPSSSCPR